MGVNRGTAPIPPVPTPEELEKGVRRRPAHQPRLPEPDRRSERDEERPEWRREPGVGPARKYK